MNYFVTTGPGGLVREFVFLTMTSPVGKTVEGDSQPGGVVFQGFVEKVGPTSPEVMFVKGFKGLEF